MQQKQINVLDYIDKQISLDQLVEMLKDYKILNQQFNEEFSYLSQFEQGISFQVEKGYLNTIYLYGPKDKKFKQYQGQLPYGLNMQLTNEQILAKLGEPDEKEGGNVMRITIVYNRLGIEFTFDTNFWENNSAKIEQIALFEKKKNQTKCGMCKSNAEYKCTQCKLVYYCDKQCQRTHWKVHKNYCQ